MAAAPTSNPKVPRRNGPTVWASRPPISTNSTIGTANWRCYALLRSCVLLFAVPMVLFASIGGRLAGRSGRSVSAPSGCWSVLRPCSPTATRPPAGSCWRSRSCTPPTTASLSAVVAWRSASVVPAERQAERAGTSWWDGDPDGGNHRDHDRPDLRALRSHRRLHVFAAAMVALVVSGALLSGSAWRLHGGTLHAGGRRDRLSRVTETGRYSGAPRALPQHRSPSATPRPPPTTTDRPTRAIVLHS